MIDIEDILKGIEELEIENFNLEAEEIELGLMPHAIMQSVRKAVEKAKQVERKFRFQIPAESYANRVHEVTLGATSSEGGTRGKTLRIGGETAPPLYFFEGKMPNKPIISHDVFDVPFRLPGFVKENFGDAMKDPAEWAKKQVKDFGADMVTLHLVSTDPNLWNRPAKDAVKTVEDVLQAVKVPIIVSGSGNYEKDAEVLTKAAEAASGERVLISSVSPGMGYETVVKAAVEHNHLILSLVSMDVPGMKQMNKKIMKGGLPADRIIMDPNMASLGYGIEYSISTMERIRLAALKGDKDLAMPIMAGVSNAWSAREAWIKDPALGPKELRGPLWETITGIIALFSGTDLYMMLHPAAIASVKEVINLFWDEKKKPGLDYEDWVVME